MSFIALEISRGFSLEDDVRERGTPDFCTVSNTPFTTPTVPESARGPVSARGVCCRGTVLMGISRVIGSNPSVEDPLFVDIHKQSSPAGTPGSRLKVEVEAEVWLLSNKRQVSNAQSLSLSLSALLVVL